MIESKYEEMGLVDAAEGDVFDNMAELHVMKYKEAMKTEDKEKWQKAVDEEHRNFEKYKVWEPIPRSEVPVGAKVLTFNWAMKKKPNGTFQVRMNA